MNIFNNKVAIITGSGSGIGKALAEELARRGACVEISDIQPDRIQKTADEIKADGGNCSAQVLDVSDYDAVKKMIEGVAAKHGRIDYIFNNAGIGMGGEAKNQTIEDWRKVVGINLFGVINGVSVAYPIMVKQGFGHIINTASVEGLVAFPATISYVAAKFGVVGISNALRVEGADYGVKVSVVCPGFIKTAIFTDAKIINVNREKMLKGNPDWIGITPEQCASVILRGVERNQAFIVVTAFAKILWALSRISPNLVMNIMRKQFNEAKKRGVLT